MKCIKCEIEKKIGEFCKDKRKIKGHNSVCKQCYNERKREQRNNNRERVNLLGRINARKNYDKYKEKRKASRKARDEKNRDNIREKRSRYWKENAERLRKRQNELKKDPEKREKVNLWMKDYRSKNKEKDLPKKKAHYLIEQAVRIGFILRPENCSECEINCRPDGHHEDYNKPLEVIWLCRACHKQRHRKYDSH